jgi:multidrug efflux system outer membrane protein
MTRLSAVPTGLHVALIALLTLGACTLAPHYQRPDTATPARWKQSTGVEPADTDQQAEATSVQSQAPEAADSTGVWPASDWWRTFNSVPLNDLIAEAQQHNDDLLGAIARVEQADAQLQIAGAALYPSVGFEGDALRQRGFITGEGPRTYNSFSTLFTASYQLDFFGKNRATRDAARAADLASHFDQQTVALTVLSSVASTYFQALELRDRIHVARQNLENGEHVLKGLHLQQEAGIATGLDVAQQETTVALLHAAIPPLVEALRQTVYSLAVLVGRTPESLDVDSGALADVAVPAVIDGMPSDLLTRRPDIANAEQNLLEANANIGVARASLFPTISLTAMGGYVSPQLSSLVTSPFRAWSAGASLTQPIFAGGALRGQLNYTKARYRELVTSYHKTVLTAFGNVESALAAAQQVSEQERRQQDAVDKAQRAYQFAQTQMSAGTVNILNVLNTENALFSAQDTLVQVQYLRLQAMINLYTALGGGWREG